MPTNTKPNRIHAQRLKAIRPFVNFDFDLRKPLSAYQKRKIKTYYDEIDALTARPYHVYRPRTPDHLKTAQEFAQHVNSLPGLKVAFIPTTGEDVPPPIIKFNKNGDMAISTQKVISRYIKLDKRKLIKDPISHVEKQISKHPEARSFTVLCGRYEIPQGQSRRSVPGFINKLCEKYSNTDDNNYFGNWLIGMAGHNYKDQDTFQNYLSIKQDNKHKIQNDRKNAKRRAKKKTKK